MKYLCIGLALLIAVGAFCAVNSRVLDRRLGEIETLLCYAYDRCDAGDAASARDLLGRASDEWEKHSEYFASVLIHSAADAAQQRIAAALGAIEAGGDCREQLGMAIEAVRSLRSNEKLLMGNILRFSPCDCPGFLL